MVYEYVSVSIVNKGREDLKYIVIDTATAAFHFLIKGFVNRIFSVIYQLQFVLMYYYIQVTELSMQVSQI